MLKSYGDPKLDSVLILTDEAQAIPTRRGEDYFTFIWNRGEPINLTIDALDVELDRHRLICLTPLQQPELPEDTGDYYMLLFNREFYCIHENDHEVSCEGLLFWGSSGLPVIELTREEEPKFDSLFQVFLDELDTRDNIQGEMLRMLLKRLIIKSTRLARNQHFPEVFGSEQTDLIRRYNVLVEQHFRELHQVSGYARLLHKSPKTLSNVFAAAGHKTPLEVIHERIALEGKRQLLKTQKMAKEIAYDLGFEDQSHFSRFFKKETGLSPSAYRRRRSARIGKGKN